MKCKICGATIQERSSFCTNCGTKINKNDKVTEVVRDAKSNNKKTLKSKLKKILPLIMIVLIIVGITIFLLNKDKNLDNVVTNEQEQTKETSKIEIGVNYNTNSNSTFGSMTGFVRFNTNTDYIMEIGDYGSESFTKTGNYTINQNIITLTVNYDSSEYEETTTPYTEKIEILEDDILKYTDRYGTICKFYKNPNDEENTEKLLLDEINEKYPNLEVDICSDENGTYWLLDSEGKKVYFSNLETFESALEKCYGAIEQTHSNENSNKINSNNNEYIDIPYLKGKTEQEAVKIVKELNAPYKIVYHEDIHQEEGIVLDQSYHDDIITNYKGEIVAATSTRRLYKGETLYIYVNQYKERTLKIEFHRSCLIENFLISANDRLTEPLNVVVKANDTIIFSDKLKNDDLRNSTVDNCKTSIISYTGKTPPVITVLVNGEVFRTYDKDYTDDWFYEESDEPHYMGFTEHGAG